MPSRGTKTNITIVHGNGTTSSIQGSETKKGNFGDEKDRSSHNVYSQAFLDEYLRKSYSTSAAVQPRVNTRPATEGGRDDSISY